MRDSILVQLLGSTKIRVLAMLLSGFLVAGHPITANPTSSVVVGVNEDRSLVLKNGNTIVLWGLKLEPTFDAKKFFVNKSIRCRELDEFSGLTLADCLLSLSSHRPDLKGEYLDLFTWLPVFAAAKKVCSTGGLGRKFGIWEKHVGWIDYGCRNSVPLRGVRVR